MLRKCLAVSLLLTFTVALAACAPAPITTTAPTLTAMRIPPSSEPANTPTAAPTSTATAKPSPSPTASNSPTPKATSTPGATTIPTPTMEPSYTIGSETISQSVVNAAVEPYVNAVNKVNPKDKQVTPDKVIAGLTEMAPKDGTKVIATNDKIAIPLLILSKESAWSILDFHSALNSQDIKYGVIADYGDDYNNAAYQRLVADADILVPSGATDQGVVDKYGPRLALGWRNTATKNGEEFRANDGFGGYGSNYNSTTIANEKDPNKIIQFMKDRLQFLIGQLQPTQLNVIPEPNYFKDGKMGWDWNYPYEIPYGNNWDAEAFKMAGEIATQNGLTPGKDIRFYYNGPEI